MSGCERFDELIERYLARDVDPVDLEALRQHSQTCPGCRRMLELLSELSGISEQVLQVPEERFGEMRASVLSRIRDGEAGQSAPGWSKPRHSVPTRSGPVSGRRWPLALTARPAYAIPFAIVLVALGFMLGRLTTLGAGFNEDLLVEEVVRQASLERGLAGYWDSPFIYSNVSFHPRGGGIVTMDFDVTRHVNVTRKLESPLTREILVHAMFDPSAMGTRLTAMGVASQAMDDKLKEALVFILLNDPSLPVRLRSLEILGQCASDTDVQGALLVSLAQDPAVQIRLLAVESLARQHKDSGLIRHAIGEPLDDNDRAVLLRAIELLGDS